MADVSSHANASILASVAEKEPLSSASSSAPGANPSAHHQSPTSSAEEDNAAPSPAALTTTTSVSVEKATPDSCIQSSAAKSDEPVATPVVKIAASASLPAVQEAPFVTTLPITASDLKSSAPLAAAVGMHPEPYENRPEESVASFSFRDSHQFQDQHNSVTIKANTNVKDAAGAICKVRPVSGLGPHMSYSFGN